MRCSSSYLSHESVWIPDWACESYSQVCVCLYLIIIWQGASTWTWLSDNDLILFSWVCLSSKHIGIDDSVQSMCVVIFGHRLSWWWSMCFFGVLLMMVCRGCCVTAPSKSYLVGVDDNLTEGRVQNCDWICSISAGWNSRWGWESTTVTEFIQLYVGETDRGFVEGI